MGSHAGAWEPGMIKIMIRFTVTRLFIDHFPKDSMGPVVWYSIYRNKLALSKRFF
ncbi:MAG: hypothetical protein KAU60_07335 [Desulfobacterales bacterium]|nr:hypothetical protein [Desulfobacterales bacterium]